MHAAAVQSRAQLFLWLYVLRELWSIGSKSLTCAPCQHLLFALLSSCIVATSRLSPTACRCLQVITREVDGKKQEPYEQAIVEVPEEHVGQVVDLLGQRKGQMLDMAAPQGNSTLSRYVTP